MGILDGTRPRGSKAQMYEPAALQEGKTSTLQSRKMGLPVYLPASVAGLGTGWLCQLSLGPTSHPRMRLPE